MTWQVKGHTRVMPDGREVWVEPRIARPGPVAPGLVRVQARRRRGVQLAAAVALVGMALVVWALAMPGGVPPQRETVPVWVYLAGWALVLAGYALFDRARRVARRARARYRARQAMPEPGYRDGRWL